MNWTRSIGHVALYNDSVLVDVMKRAGFTRAYVVETPAFRWARKNSALKVPAVCPPRKSEAAGNYCCQTRFNADMFLAGPVRRSAGWDQRYEMDGLNRTFSVATGKKPVPGDRANPPVHVWKRVCSVIVDAIK